MNQTLTPKSDFELLDEEAFAVPDRLTPEDCFEHLGTDWRCSSAPADPEDER